MLEEEQLESSIRDYISKHFKPYVNGNDIRFGNASFTVNMLVQGSIDTYKLNPGEDIFNIVDYMFDYYCS